MGSCAPPIVVTPRKRRGVPLTRDATPRFPRTPMAEDILHPGQHPQGTFGEPRLHTGRLSAVQPEDLAGEGANPRTPTSAQRRLAAPLVRMLDSFALTIALFLTLSSSPLQHGQSLEHFLSIRVSVRNLCIEVAFLVLWRAFFSIAGLYQPRLNRSAGSFFWKVPLTVVFCTGIVLPLLHMSRQRYDLLPAGMLFFFSATSVILLIRAGVLTYEEHIRPALRARRTVLICGTGIRARLLAMQLPTHPDFRYHLAGFVDSDPQPECLRIGAVLGTISELETLLMRLPIDEVIVALPIKSHFAEIEDIVRTCGRAGIQTQYSLELFTSDIAKYHAVDSAEGTRMVVGMVHEDQRLVFKSILDRIAAALGLILLSPLFALLALGVRLSSPGPIFFVQQRFGLGKRTFGMIKFRSMVQDAEARQMEIEHLNEHAGPTFKIRQDPRVTPFGSFLRRSSLDELPQLWNVLRGDMSLVGPRPLPARDVSRFSEAWLMRRFSVKPGITGLWQVSGRSNTDFDSAIKLDLRYIDRWSLLLDAKILLRTFGAVFRGKGAY